MGILLRYSSRRPLNGAAVLAFAIVTLCTPVAAQNIPRRIDHNTIEDPASTLILDVGGIVYNVPVNRLDTFVEPDKTVPTEVAGGFSIVGLLPDFEMRNAENAHEFAGEVPADLRYRRVVTASVRRICPTDAQSCEAAQVWESMFNIYGGDTFFESQDIAAPEGLSVLGLANNVGGSQSLSKSHHATFRPQTGDDRSFITCDVGGAPPLPNPLCQDFVPWLNGTYVTVIYSFEHLDEWKNIRTIVLNELRSFRTSH